MNPAPENNHSERFSEHLKDVCETLGLNNIKTPVNVQDLTNIGKLFNVSINLYIHSKSDIYPIRTTKSTASKHIDLLVTSNSEINHYVWIRDFNKLCYNISSQDKLEQHLLDCVVLEDCQAIEMPPGGEVDKFKSFREIAKIPFVIYADLESILYKLAVSQKQEMKQEQTEKLQKTCSLLLWLYSSMLL